MNTFSGDTFSLPRKRYVQALASASILLAGIALLTNLVQPLQAGADVSLNLILLLLVIALNAFWLLLAWRGRLTLAVYGVIAMFVVAVLLLPMDQTFLLVAMLTIVTIATLAGRRVYLLANVLVLGRFVVEIVQTLLNPSSAAAINLFSVVAPLIMLAFISMVTRYFVNAGQRAVMNSRGNADLLQATAEIGQVVSQLLDLDELLDRAVNLIANRFDYYHVQIFLVNDTRDQAVLVASTGEVGKRLLSRGHQLSVGSQSVIGQAMLRRAPVLVSNTERDPIYFHNELLPNTRSELALPIREGDQAIGALDFQSLNSDDFRPADQQGLQITADLLATAIRNARLFKAQAKTVEENERLYRDAENNLREIQRLNQQLTRVAWQDYQAEASAVTGITLERDIVLPASEWSTSLLRAGQEVRVVESQSVTSGDHNTVAVPVILRGEVIGAIEVEAGTENNPETIEMVQAVAQRLALSLENARLYESTVQAAAQEQRINAIATRFQSVATVDDLLRITLAELSETLGAERSSIRLGRFTAQNGSASHD